MQIFVYGTLKKGFYNHLIMNKAKGIMMGKCAVKNFGCINTPSFPYAVKSPGRRIFGEVYDIPEKNIHILDGLEGYPTHYDREIVDTDFGDAWIYFAKDDMKTKIERYGFVEEWNYGEK